MRGAADDDDNISRPHSLACTTRKDRWNGTDRTDGIDGRVDEQTDRQTLGHDGRAQRYGWMQDGSRRRQLQGRMHVRRQARLHNFTTSDRRTSSAVPRTTLQKEV